ncbi:hypothetical protein [Vibrio quintilis]|uniref:Uncharacterized protein n=1 Tax=Vibrio quintilis TaxID=1117707 RepID=A0A1M7YU10_9VIBR|nr:hypothetical protein [Vibrio quintilis]SHO56144.1 hypothetical protein VQ7734_01911 [Vibrio quintilis]
MKPETLLAKFDLKGINYEQTQTGGGKGLFTLEEQLAMVGIEWKQSPVGFLILFVEIHSCPYSRHSLEVAVTEQLNKIAANQRGQRSPAAFDAMVHVAIEESITPSGRVCPTCNGSGLYKTPRRQTRNCIHCQDGRIIWNTESRFAVMCSGGFACSYDVFKRRYHPVLEQVAKWLAGQRNAAMLALMERIEKEEAA